MHTRRIIGAIAATAIATADRIVTAVAADAGGQDVIAHVRAGSETSFLVATVVMLLPSYASSRSRRSHSIVWELS